MAVDANVLLQVKTVPLGGAPSAAVPLRDGWLYLLQGSSVQVLHTNGGGITSFDGSGQAPRDQWWQFNTSFKAKIGDGLQACFSRGARPVPQALLTPDLFVAATVVSSAPPLMKLTKASAAAGSPGVVPPVQHSLALRLGSIVLPDVGVFLDTPEELGFWPLTHLNAVLGDAYYTEGFVQGTDAFRSATSTTLITQDFDPNGPVARSGAAATQAPAPAVALPTRGFKIAGHLSTRATAAELSVQDNNGNSVQLFDTADLSPTSNFALKLDNGAFSAEIFFPPPQNQGTAPTLSPSFGVIDLVITTTAPDGKFVESFSLHLCGVELGIVDDSDTPTLGRGRVQTGADELLVADFSSPHAQPKVVDQQALLRSQRLHCYLIRTAIDPTGVAPVSSMPQWMIELRLIGVSLASLGLLGMHRYFRDTKGVIEPLFGGASNQAPANDGFARSSPRVTLSVRFNFDYQFEIAWRGRNDDLLPSSYGTVPLTMKGSVAAHLRLDEQGNVCGPGFEQLRTSDNTIPLALDAQPQIPGRRTPALRVDQPYSFGRHGNEPAQPSLVLEALPIADEVPIPVNASITALLARRGVKLPPKPATLPAIRGGMGSLELSKLSLGFSVVDSTDAAFRQIEENLLERVPEGAKPSTIDTNAARVGGVHRIIPASGPPLSAPIIRVAGRNLNQTNAFTLLDNTVRAMIPAGGLFFLSQNCWVLTARLTVLNEAGGRMFNPGTFIHILNVGPNHFGVESGTPIFGPPNGYGVCQLDPPTNGAPVAPAVFGQFDRRIWDYEANIERGVELLIQKAQASFGRFQSGQHYAVVARKNTVVKGVTSINNGQPKFVTTAAAGAAWTAIQNTPTGRAMLQREIVRGFGGGFEFTFFASSGTWGIWSTPARQFWEIHVDNKIVPPGLVMARSQDPGIEGQATVPFDATFFGPGVDEVGAL